MKSFAARMLALGLLGSALCLRASEPSKIPERISLKGLPSPGTWINAPKAFVQLPHNAFSLVAGEGTDLYNDCSGKQKTASVPMLLFEPDEDFVLTSGVTGDFKHEFDGALLLIWEDEDHWGRLLFQKSHEGPLSVGTAVTRTFSDDSMNVEIKAKQVWFRIARVGTKIYFYLSRDGKQWSYIRYFRWPGNGKAKVGFAAQSPEGTQCKATFFQISYSPKAPRDLWTGE
jgi:regulation of enolase protein 1 (concanavalin A-like superfamily)